MKWLKSTLTFRNESGEYETASMSQCCCLELTLHLLSQPKIPLNYLSRGFCMLSWGCKVSCTNRKTFYCIVSASINHWLISPLLNSDLLDNQMKEERKNVTYLVNSASYEKMRWLLGGCFITCWPDWGTDLILGPWQKNNFTSLSLSQDNRLQSDTDPQQKYVTLRHSGKEMTLVFGRKKVV